jgi:hypothetical protein
LLEHLAPLAQGLFMLQGWVPGSSALPSSRRGKPAPAVASGRDRRIRRYRHDRASPDTGTGLADRIKHSRRLCRTTQRGSV